MRPEHIEICDAARTDETNMIAGTIERETFSGKLIEYVVRIADMTVRAQCTSAKRWPVGAAIMLRLPPERCVLVNGAPGDS